MATQTGKSNNSTALLWVLIAIIATEYFLTGWSDNAVIKKSAPFLCVVCMTLFAFIHGFRQYGLKRMLVFFLLTFAISWSYETSSILTGFPFGHYYYSDTLGIKLWLVPVLIMPAYFTVCYLSWNIAHVLLDKFRTAMSNKTMLFALPVIASFLMVMWDVTMDPAQSTISKTWVWQDGGVYFGVPFQNFMGWFLCVYTILQIWAFYLRSQLRSVLQSEVIVASKMYWLQPIVMYGIIPIYSISHALFKPNIEVKSLDNRSWWTEDIYGSMALIALFTILPITVIAVVKIFTSRELIKA